MGIALLFAYALFAVTAICALGGLILLWPVLRSPHRRRAIGLIVLVAIGGTTLVLGQKLLDDVVGHVAQHPPHPEPTPASHSRSPEPD